MIYFYFFKYKCVSCLGVYTKYTPIEYQTFKTNFPSRYSALIFFFINMFLYSKSQVAGSMIVRKDNLKIFALYILNYLQVKTFFLI